MKKRNGFTLIELLAIIVILAIIAVITVPIILNIIDNAKMGAVKDSAYGYKDAINKYYLTKLSENPDFEFTNGTYTKEQLKSSGVTVSGQEPGTNSWVTIENNNVVAGCIQYDEYKVEIENGKITTVEKGICETLYAQYNAGTIVKYDPVANSKCTDGETCYTWNIITVGDSKTNNKITMQMDHNITKSPWIAPSDYPDQENLTADGKGKPDKGPITAFNALEAITSSWDDSLLLNYTYDTSLATKTSYGVLTCTNGTCTNGAGQTIITNLKARMITVEEIAALAKNAGAAVGSNADVWTIADRDISFYFSNSNRTIGTQTAVDGTGDTSLSWLVQNTYPNAQSGATANSYGANEYRYWTLSPQANTNYMIWGVMNTGDIGYSRAYENYGIRPVITVDKTVLE